MITLDLRHAAKWLWTVAAALVILHVVVAVAHQIRPLPCLVYDVFNLEEDDSLGHLFITLTLLLGGLLALYQSSDASADTYTARMWAILGLGLCALALVHALLLHQAMRIVTGMSPVAIFIPVAATLAVAYVPFLARLPAATRNALVLAAVLFAAGILVEVATDAFAGGGQPESCRRHTLGLSLTSGLESALEISGVLVFVTAMIGLISVRRRSPPNRQGPR